MARYEGGETGDEKANGAADGIPGGMTPDLEELGQWLRLGKAAIFSDSPGGGADTGADRETIRKILAAAKKSGGSGTNARRFPHFAAWSSLVAAAAVLVIWTGILQTPSLRPGVTLANFIRDGSGLLPAMRGGEGGAAARWLAAARAGTAAGPEAGGATVADVPEAAGRPSPGFLRQIKTSRLLTLEEAEHEGETCLALRLYAVETGKVLEERLIFPLEEDDIEAAIEKATRELEHAK